MAKKSNKNSKNETKKVDVPVNSIEVINNKQETLTINTEDFGNSVAVLGSAMIDGREINMDDMNFTELYNSCNCLAYLIKYYTNLSEMNIGNNSDEYKKSSEILNKLRKYENKLRDAIENKILKIKL